MKLITSTNIRIECVINIQESSSMTYAKFQG